MGLEYIKRQKQLEKERQRAAKLEAEAEAARVAKQEEIAARKRLFLEQQREQEAELLRQKNAQRKEKLAEQKWNKQFDTLLTDINDRCQKEKELEEIRMTVQNRELPLQEFDSRNTSINSSKMPKSIKILEKKGKWLPGTVNLDLGGGRFDNVTEFLETKDVQNLILDPYNRSSEHNEQVLRFLQEQSVDTVTLNNVLNVIKETEIQNQLLNQAAQALKPDGMLFILVYEGDKSGGGRCTKPGQWQENRKTRDYVDQVLKVFDTCEMKYGLLLCANPTWGNS